MSDEREVALGVLLSLDQPHPTPMTGELLATLLPASLADPAFPLGEIVLEAAEQLPASCVPILASHIRQFAEAPLTGPWRTNPKAASALARRDPISAVDLLLRALDAALHAAETSGQEVLEALSSWATSLAGALARIAPLRLLPYPRDCDPIRAALQEWAQETGHLVFDDGILDPSGRELRDQ